jgi:hypothetical protein
MRNFSLRKKVVQKFGLRLEFSKKTAQSKQSSIGRKFAPSGHPARLTNICEYFTSFLRRMLISQANEGFGQ